MKDIIQNPFGIETFGSAIINVVPDVAVVRCGVVQMCDLPEEAFKKTKEAASRIKDYMSQMDVDDVTESQQYLEQKFNRDHPLGYEAKIVFHIRVVKLESVEAILSGLVSEGVNRIYDVEYGTTDLANYRESARELAIKAASDKVLVYSKAANVKVGKLLHIQDLPPESFVPRRFHTKAISSEAVELGVSEPGSIPVCAAVRMAYEIGDS